MIFRNYLYAKGSYKLYFSIYLGIIKLNKTILKCNFLIKKITENQFLIIIFWNNFNDG